MRDRSSVTLAAPRSIQAEARQAVTPECHDSGPFGAASPLGRNGKAEANVGSKRYVVELRDVAVFCIKSYPFLDDHMLLYLRR